MPDTASTAAPVSKLGATCRTDAWWAGPLATATVLISFVVYATFRAIAAIGANPETSYEVGQEGLLSPFFSPNLAHFFTLPAWLSPAFLILWAPGGFRVTCYYYRKAYYRSLFLDPPACAVGEPRQGYKGETSLLLFQNLHRYFLYVAILILFILWFDVWKALWPQGQFGVTVGTLVLGASSLFLTLYTISCHSLRHLTGGRLDCFSCSASTKRRFKVWSFLTRLNEHHMLWAWVSLFGVALADLYVWMVASGRIPNVSLL